ncbi:MAG: DUF4381 domain-containing protein [Parachlamydia sp.]|nr:DUF4381 domain-containing protein [Parachlamydia sp.]
MNNLLEQLHDIDGLDAVSSWPLAIGWWVLIGIGAILAGALLVYACRWVAFRRSWKHDTLQKLAALERDLSDETARKVAITLSEYLRRISLRRFSRKECAGLTGEAWLKWLAGHDPKKFDWEKKGALLSDMPYAPLQVSPSAHQMKELIQAVRNWVR